MVKKDVFEIKVKFLMRFVIIAIILVIGLSRSPKVDAYYGMGGMMGGLYAAWA